MFVHTDYEIMLTTLGQKQANFTLNIIPKDTPYVANSPYRDGYDWLFACEQQLAKKLAPWLAPLRFELLGEKGLLNEALANAFCHGHGKQADRPICLKIFVGDKGILLSVLDTGQGFDVDTALKQFFSGAMYYQIAGNGFSRMAASTDFNILYDQDGRRCTLVHFFA